MNIKITFLVGFLAFFSINAFAIKGPMNIELDSKLWRYFPPGALKPGGLLPISKSDGVLVKNLGADDKRIVYLVREAPLTTTLQEYCSRNQKFQTTESVELSEKTCFIVSKENKGVRSYQLVYSNVRALKLVSLSIQVPNKQVPEVLKDYDSFKKGISK